MSQHGLDKTVLAHVQSVWNKMIMSRTDELLRDLMATGTIVKLGESEYKCGVFTAKTARRLLSSIGKRKTIAERRAELEKDLEILRKLHAKDGLDLPQDVLQERRTCLEADEEALKRFLERKC